MRYLYIFPHPDDESFGPAAAMHRQRVQGDEVYLYTLTRGEATRQRFVLGVDKATMGEIRYQEMLDVETCLNLNGMKVDDFVDGEMQDMDPRIIEAAVRAEIERIRPDVVVSYPVHGVSGFHDHLVMHAVVKRVFLEMREQGADYLKRLAFLTLPDAGGPAFNKGHIRFKNSAPELIDCIMELQEEEIEAMKQALLCYGTYQETIKESKVIEKIGDKLYFEFFQEAFDPPLKELHANLPKVAASQEA